ncbi:hypothetical protein D7V91_06670 [bacterium 1xD42-67]|nr:hypothetical protein D7V91_06670 [bacterium 1xD42-67]
MDLENWERREHYLHFLNEVRCSYSVSVDLDTTSQERPPGSIYFPAGGIFVLIWPPCERGLARRSRDWGILFPGIPLPLRGTPL